MQSAYDPQTDVFTLSLGAAEDGRRDEVRPGVFLRYDETGRLVGLEVHQASSRLPDALTGRPAAEDAPTPVDTGRVQPAPVVVYSDGACVGNPGPGGWAARVKHADGRIVELGGAARQTTNNRMEMLAAIEALASVPEGTPVTMITDSQYLRRGITEWIRQWKRRGWLTVSKQPVLNQDLWQRLDELCSSRRVNWQYTRGHAGNPDNERCDTLAQAFSRGQSPRLRQE
ncbi:MAG: ribonuclease HI [Candidatus Latescibacterota bacterium]